MIPKKERALIKQFFGTGFSKKIAKKLNDKNIRNRNGVSFKPHSISDILNGRNHSLLEKEVRKIWEEEVVSREAQSQSLIERTKNLLK